ncbi:hypothetical protein BTZ20_5069 [Rhodococcus sp. MTM3W5.2]|nr:hypothetical protein BTZ20_5069 [Rhodococcus sp. MTM3W5.2]
MLAYYLIANCSALTLTRTEGRAWPGIPILGALGCVVLGFALPLASVLSGLAVLGAGALVYVIRRRTTPRDTQRGRLPAGRHPLRHRAECVRG